MRLGVRPFTVFPVLLLIPRPIFTLIIIRLTLDANMEWERNVLDGTELTTVVQMFILQSEEVPLPTPMSSQKKKKTVLKNHTLSYHNQSFFTL